MALNFEAVRRSSVNFANDVRQVYQVRKAYLFGSYAKGTATDQSDVDVCFFVDNYSGHSRYEIIANLLSIGAKYRNIPFEPLVFPFSEIARGNPFVREVIDTGEEI